MATLPTISIPDADVPRLRAALRSTLTTAVGVPGISDNSAEINALTDAQLYKRFVIPLLREAVRTYEQRQAIAAAQTNALAGLTDPPTLT